MSEQSQKQEMNAAIRAHRERHNVPRSIAPEPVAPPPSAPAVAPAKKGLLGRLFGK
jgi:hypothetical protein